MSRSGGEVRLCRQGPFRPTAMRRFTALRAAVCALVALLIAPAVHAQAVRDSVKITVFSTYDEFLTRYGGSFGQPVYYVCLLYTSPSPRD